MTIVIGLTGSFASGCTYISKEFIVPKGYNYLSLSSVLIELFNEDNPEIENPKRHELQQFGTNIRKQNGPDFLAKKIVEKISDHDKWVIDSIKNPHEINFLRDTYPNFYLFAVFANYGTRWKRAQVPEIYNGDQRSFNQDDERDKDEELDYGQKVSDCCSKADVIICNDKQLDEGSRDYRKLGKKVENFLNLIEGGHYTPDDDEPFMVMAYANSLRSSCLKRKVGAIIIDANGNICSSGYNEVPTCSSTCDDDGGCYREKVRQDFHNAVKEIEDDETKQEKIVEKFKSCKILDYCKALHAEESSIVNLAKSGMPTITQAKLYTTTYPCNLCAKKIAQVGIKDIVYLEPYPMIEAKKILDENKVKSKPFEGITPRGYFRFGGE